MRSLAGFGGIEILTYALMSNHFHVLAYVPQRREVSDDELAARLACILPTEAVQRIIGQLRDFRAQGHDAAADALKARYTYRMHDISEFFKALKQRFSQFHNAREGRQGPLWEQRFKSILVERSEKALLTVAAYVDLNAVRAGIVKDPKDYRYSGYGEAMGGSKVARDGLRTLVKAVRCYGRVSWGRAQETYRQRLYVQGQQRGCCADGRPIRRGFTPQQVQEVIEAGGRLPLHELLRCRIRYFTDGLALGGREFLQAIFQRYRSHFGPKRTTGPRSMRFADWGELYTLHDLRLQIVFRQ
jgi:REP element-mobilizing transposase RayT